MSSRNTAILFWLIAVAIYASAIGWGLPHATTAESAHTLATDEIVPLGPLAEMHNTFVVTKPDRNYAYPWLHYFVVAVAQAPYLAGLMVSGGLSAPSATYPFGFEDPEGALQALTLIGRAITLAMAGGVVVAAFHFSRILWGYAAGVVAAMLTLLNYLMFYYGRNGNLDVPVFFWTAWALVVFARILVDRFTTRRAVWLGILVALALATKDQAVATFLPLGCALLVPALRSPAEQGGYRPRLIFIALGACLATYLIAAGMLVDPDRHITHIYRLLFEPESIRAPLNYYPLHQNSWAGWLGLMGDYVRGLVNLTSWPVLLVSLVGVILAARSSPRMLVLLLPVLTIFLMITVPSHLFILRYLLPLVLILDAFAAYALIRMRRSRFRPAWVPLLVLMCGFRLMVGADLTYAQWFETREAASGWIEEFARPGERVEYFGATHKLPRLSSELQLRRVAGRTVWQGEVGHAPAVLRALETDPPEFIVLIPDWTSPPGGVMDRSHDCPPEVYAALKGGAAGYSEVAFYPTPTLVPGVRPHLDYPTVSPPVTIFANGEVLERIRAEEGVHGINVP